MSLKVVEMPEPPAPKHTCGSGLRAFYHAEKDAGRQLPARCVVACICGRRWKLLDLSNSPMIAGLANIRRDKDLRDNPVPGMAWDYVGRVIADWYDLKDVRDGGYWDRLPAPPPEAKDGWPYG